MVGNEFKGCLPNPHTGREEREEEEETREKAGREEGKGIKRRGREDVNHAELSNTPIKYAAVYWQTPSRKEVI